MDNHIHMLVQAKSSEHLGHFMRTVNSQVATFINNLYERDSQAIRERYKSPLITNNRYLLSTMQYIWMNRYRVNGSRPDRDPYCSASWRLNQSVVKKIAKDLDEELLLKRLLDTYDELPIQVSGSPAKFARDLLNKAVSQLNIGVASLFSSSHTIGDSKDVAFRGHLLSAFRRETVPWVSG